MQPVVAITSYTTRAAWGSWSVPSTLVPHEYVTAVHGAGGVPVVVPVLDPVYAARLLARFDALVLSGGPDVHPGRYGDSVPAVADAYDEARDAWELALVAEAERVGLPLLGICRGMQLLNVARGGSLIAHLPSVVGHDHHSPGPGSYGQVNVELSGTLASLLSERTTVTCHHHQAVSTLGSGLRPVAVASDGVIEAVEDPSKLFVVGVQWHAEHGRDASLFEALVNATHSSPAVGVGPGDDS